MKTKILELIDKQMLRVHPQFTKPILQELRREIEEMDDWIPVTEITGNINCLFTDFHEYGVGYNFGDDYIGISFIPTHYMPLPPHP